MKVIGMLGGMSWESTKTYYHLLNSGVKEQLGGLNSARILLNSVNFAVLENCLKTGDWQGISSILSEEARKLQAGGAEGILLCTNTMHKVFPDIEEAIDIPIFHIADALGAQLAADGIEKIGLLGTRFTMVEDFYSQRLKDQFGIETIIPEGDDINLVDRVVFEELCLGTINESSKHQYLEIMDKLAGRGAQAIALACTEIEILIKPEDTEIQLYDTTAIHSDFAVKWSLA